MPYTRDEWRLTISGRFLTKMFKNLKRHRVNPFSLVNLMFKSYLYRKMYAVLEI